MHARISIAKIRMSPKGWRLEVQDIFPLQSLFLEHENWFFWRKKPNPLTRERARDSERWEEMGFIRAAREGRKEGDRQRGRGKTEFIPPHQTSAAFLGHACLPCFSWAVLAMTSPMSARRGSVYANERGFWQRHSVTRTRTESGL